MARKHLYIILLFLFVAFIGKAQMNSPMSSKKGFSAKSSSSKKGNSSSKDKKSKSRSSSFSKKDNDTKGSSSSKNASGSSVSASTGGISSAKSSKASIKATITGRSYPGIGKSKAIAGLKGGTKYSYPGVHNLRWDVDKLKKKSSSGSK